MRAAAALLILPLLPAAAAASGFVEHEGKPERFRSRAACEKALKGHYAAAAARFAAMTPEDRRSSKVEPPYREDDGRLAYYQVLDLTVTTPDMVLPRSQTEEFNCRGSVLEHRIYLEGGSFVFMPPPPPPAPEPRQP